MFSQNPLDIEYKKVDRPNVKSVPELSWTSFDEGVYKVGHDGDGFGYDNEYPRHKTYIHEFELTNRLVTNSEFIEFIESGAYGEPKWWLDEGFSTVRDENWNAPLYWEKKDGDWWQFTLSGMQKSRY